MGPAPAIAALLTGHGYEAEIAHRGAVGLRVAIDDDHALAATRGRQGMRQPANAGADDRDVKGACWN